MEQYKSINKLTSRKLPLVRTFLALKFSLCNFLWFYIICVIFKLLGLLIITSNFAFDWGNLYSFKVAYTIRSLTSYGLFSKCLNAGSYPQACYSLFAFLLIFVLLCHNFYLNVKTKEDHINTQIGDIKMKIISVMFNIILLTSQHMLELFSFVYYAYFNTNLTKNILSGNIFNDLTFKDNATNILLLITNSVSIIFLNFFFYFSYKIVNEPFFNSKFPIRLRYTGISIFLLILISNLQALHYIELLISTENSRLVLKYILFTLINFFILLAFIKNFHNFSFNTCINNFIFYFFSFAFFSSLVEIVIYHRDEVPKDVTQVLYVLFCKFIITTCFFLFYKYINKRLFVLRSKTNLFKFHQGDISRKELETFYFIIDLLINNQNGKDMSSFFYIIFSHKSECVLDFCKCNIIGSMNSDSLKKDIHFTIETMFTSCNLNKEREVNILFSEYLFMIKNSLLFSYSILNTYISRNSKAEKESFSNLEIVELYSISFSIVKEYEKFMITNSEDGKVPMVNFKNIFKEIKIKNNHEKNILKLINFFEDFLNFKEKFDNSLKINEEECKLDSHLFDNSLDNIVTTSTKYYQLYKKMKNSFIKEFTNKQTTNIELSYKIYLFFTICNKKVPSSVLNLVFNDQDAELRRNNDITKYFDNLFAKYFSSNDTLVTIIVEINKSFTIKHISYKFCQILGRNYNDLIGEDLQAVLPHQFRDAHARALVDFFLVNKQSHFHKKSFLYDKNKNILPIQLNVLPFPNLGKNLQTVVTCKIIGKIEPRHFYFIVGEMHELIGLSENFNSIYSIDYDLISTVKIDLLKLFDIHHLMAKFKPQLDKLEKLRSERALNSLYSLSNYVFNLSQNEEYHNKNLKNYSTEVAFKIKGTNKNDFGTLRMNGTNIVVKEIDKINNEKQKDFGDPKSNAAMSSKSVLGGPKSNAAVSSKSVYGDPKSNKIGGINSPGPALKRDERDGRDGNTIITSQPNEQKTQSRYFKLLNKVNEWKKEQEKYENLQNKYSRLNEESNSYCLFRNKKTVIRNLKKYTNICRDMQIEEKYLSKLTDAIILMEDSTVPGKEGSFTESFKIKVEFRKITDTPFFVVSVKEKLIPKKMPPAKPKFSLFKKLLTKKIAEDEDVEIKEDYKENKFIGFKDTCEPNNKESISSTVDVTDASSLVQKKGKYFYNSFNNKSPIIAKFSKKNKNLSLKTVYFFWVIFFLILNTCLCAFIFYLSEYSTSVNKYLFLIMYFANYQEASLVFLYSAVLSFTMKLSDLSNFETNYLNNLNATVDTKMFQNLIIERLMDFRENNAMLYDSVKNSQYDLPILKNYLFSPNLNLDKTLLTWEKISYNTSFNSAVDYISINTRIFALEEDFDDLLYDIDNAVLYRQYAKANKNMRQHSINSKLIYFLSQNGADIINVLQNMIDFTESTRDDFNAKWENISFAMEMLSIAFSVISIVLIYFVLLHYDRVFFKIILSFFIDLRKGKKIYQKSNLEITFLRAKLTNYKELIYCFSRENIKKIDEILNFNEVDFLTGVSSKYVSSYSNFNTISMVNLHSSVNNVNNNNLYANLNTGTYNNTNINTNTNIKAFVNTHTVTGYDSNINTMNNAYNQIPDNNSLVTFNVNNSFNVSNMPLKFAPKLNATAVKRDKNERNSKTKKKIETAPQEKLISNGQILEDTKHSSLNLIKSAKLLIFIIFFFNILFIVSKVGVNRLQYSRVDLNMRITNDLMIRIPIMTHMFNLIRLMVLETESSYEAKFFAQLVFYSGVAKSHDTFINSYGQLLTNTHTFAEEINGNNFNLKNEYLCKNVDEEEIFITSSGANICSLLLSENNPFNKQGIMITYKTVIQILSNTNRDFSLLLKSKGKEALSDKNIIRQFLRTEEFANVNLQLEFIYDSINHLYMKNLSTDMMQLFDESLITNIITSLIAILLNIGIILYLLLGFFRTISKYNTSISFAAGKFNKALFGI